MKNKEIIVSVIVLAYNQENFIGCALDSILMQNTDFPYEILVGDDCSTDDTPNILREYASRHPDRIRLFLREENLGAARNSYELLLQSKGRYLAFCEGDDYWTCPEKLQKQVRFLQEHPDFIGCSHRCEIVDENGVRKKDQSILWVSEKSCFTLKDFKGIYLPGQTATIMKRNIFLDTDDRYRFLYETNKHISDRTSTLLYLTKGSFGFIPETMSAYRRVSNSGITNRIYESNESGNSVAGVIMHELNLTHQLEELSKELTDEKGLFKGYYMQLYEWAVSQFIKHPSAGNFEVVKASSKPIGFGVVHPVAFILGLLMRKGKIK